MALSSGSLKAVLPYVWVGVGIAVAAPIVLPALAGGFRPLAKGLIKGYLAMADAAREAVSETGERWGDLVAEARAERVGEPDEAPPA